MSAASAVTIAGARVVHHDRVDAATLAFAGGRVVDVPPAGALAIDLRDHLVFPGLINAHDHLQLNGVPPLPHDAPFPNAYAWIDAFAPHHARADVAAAVAVPKGDRLWHGALKNALAGVTTVAHHDPWHDALDDADLPVDVPRGAGWCHSLGLASAGRYGPPPRASHDATPRGRPWIVHLAEGTDAVAGAELAWLDALGCLTERTVLVHGVGLSDADVGRVIACGAAVVWCPASNLGMLGRTLAPRRLFDAGRLALGTDSRLTGARDLLDELRVAASASDLSAAELLRLVTADAAQVLRLHDRGALDEGCRADCVIVRAGADPHAALLHASRGALRAVVRGGVPVIADPDLAHWFAHCGVDAVPARLDGWPKLVARAALRPGVAEPGLALGERPHVTPASARAAREAPCRVSASSR